MKISEILREDTSTDASIKNIIDILTTQIPDLYRKLSRMAENYATSHEELGNGFRFVQGGQKTQWFHNVFFQHFKPALYNLAKGLPKNLRTGLSAYLSSSEGFNSIENSLYGILEKIAQDTKNQALLSAVSTAKRSVDDFYKLCSKLDRGDGEEEPTQSPKAPKDNTIAKQNSSVEQIVNDALSRIDKRQVGEIRNIIAKSQNKLVALQQEFTKRGIKI